jgi:hypothetical protein
MENVFAQSSGLQGESLDITLVESADACMLGQWINGEGKQYEGTAPYQEVVLKHNRFHEIVAEVVRKAKSGEKEGAEAMLNAGREFSGISREIVSAIMQLKKVVASQKNQDHPGLGNFGPVVERYGARHTAGKQPRSSSTHWDIRLMGGMSGGCLYDRQESRVTARFVAEKEGFEPPVGCPTTVFKTAALNRSATSPEALIIPSGAALG